MEEKTKTTEVVLALRPGRREMGVAVLEAGELVDWRVSCFRDLVGEALLNAVERRVRGLVQRFEPTVVAIEEPSSVRLRMSPLLGEIVRVIQSVAVDAGLEFVAVAPAQVREQVCGSVKATHAQMVEKIVERFPHLGRYRKRPSAGGGGAGRRGCQRGEDYWGPMFSAVGVGLVVSAKATRSLGSA